MIEVLILVCALTVNEKDCSTDTALQVVVAPEHAKNMPECQRTGLLFSAMSSLVTPGTYPKIICRPMI